MSNRLRKGAGLDAVKAGLVRECFAEAGRFDPERLAAAIKAMTTALSLMRGVIESGEPIDRPDLLAGIEDIMQLMDYDATRALEARLLGQDVIERKYGGPQ